MQPFAKVAAIVIVVLVITVLPGAPVNAAPSIGVVKLIKVNAYGTPSGESQREIFIRSEIFPSELVETSGAPSRSSRARRGASAVQ